MEIEGADRLLLVLGLMYPSERFARIQRGLASFMAMLARAQIGLLARRAKLGQTVTAVRDVTKLSGVRVGA